MATMETACSKKEQNILDLSVEIAKTVNGLRARLDNYFDRSGKCGETAERPQEPNVLDEIITNLVEDLSELRSIASFISDSVLPKIK